MRHLILLASLLLASPAWAQEGHPCTQTAPSSVTIPAGVPHFLKWCSPEADRIEALVVTVDQVPTALLPVAVLSAPSASGLVLYQTGFVVTVGVGTHLVEAAAYNTNTTTGVLQRGPSAALTVLAVAPSGGEAPLPAPPTDLGLARE